MSRLKIILYALLASAFLSIVGVLGLTLVFYQVTPKSVLAQDTFIGRIQPVLLFARLADRSVNFLYRGPATPESVPIYSLEVDQKELDVLEKEIQKLEVFIEDDAKLWMPATFTADGEEYAVKMRIRGDRFNHWQFRKKSWRIKFPKDHLFNGMRQITLILPEDRAWHAELMNQYRAEQFGLLQPPMRFVGLQFNGSAPLAYLEVEHWTKEMLEKQNYSGDVNFFNPGGALTSSFDGWDLLKENIGYSGKYLENSNRPHDSMEELELLFQLAEKDAHLQPDFTEKVFTLFDFDTVIKWHAQSFLAGNLHAGLSNMRIFFDGSRGKFIPIPWDIHITTPKPLLAMYPSEFWQEVFAIPEWKLALHQFLWEQVGDPDDREQNSQKVEELRAMVEELAYRDPYKLLSNRQVKNDLDKRTREMRANLESIAEQLQVSEVLVTQRLPSSEERNNAIQLIIDVTVRGPTESLFEKVVLPEGMNEEKFTLIPEKGSSFLLSPEQPETNDLGIPTGVSHAQYRFILRGPVSVEEYIPLKLDIRNAVTHQPSDLISVRVVQ